MSLALLLALASCKSGSPSDGAQGKDTQATAESLWDSGNKSFEAKRYPEARAAFQQLADLYPRHDRVPAARYFSALAFTNEKKWTSALDGYKRLVAEHPQSELADDALYFGAMAAIEVHQCKQAMDLLSALDDGYPESNVRGMLNDAFSSVGVNCCAKLVIPNECWVEAANRRPCTSAEKTMRDALISSSCGGQAKGSAEGRCYAINGFKLRRCTRREAADDSYFEPEATSATPDPVSQGQAGRLTLPGWDDLVLGQAPPADAMQSCRKAPLRDTSMVLCTACRSAKLPTPCLEFAMFEDKKVTQINADLPQDETSASAVIEKLQQAWGPSTGTLDSRIESGELTDQFQCWTGSSEEAVVAKHFYESASTDPSALSYPALHPKRNVLIKKVKGTCSPPR